MCPTCSSMCPPLARNALNIPAISQTLKTHLLSHHWFLWKHSREIIVDIWPELAGIYTRHTNYLHVIISS